MGLKLPVGSQSWPVFPLCGLCASKYISFSFVSILFLVKDRDSRQWERAALFDMQDLTSAWVSTGFHLHADAVTWDMLRSVQATWAVAVYVAEAGST